MCEITTADAIEWFEQRKVGVAWPGIRAMYDKAINALRVQQKAEKEPGEISDGYHTFNELYHHRAILFSVICNQNADIAWKSKKHYDGTMYDGMFIVGIETPDGQATYHYDIDPYWDMFRVLELDHAPEWDGHTPSEAIRRIGMLSPKGWSEVFSEVNQFEKTDMSKTCGWGTSGIWSIYCDKRMSPDDMRDWIQSHCAKCIYGSKEGCIHEKFF